MPLEQPSTRRVPGVLAGKVSLPPPETLLDPLPEDDVEALKRALP